MNVVVQGTTNKIDLGQKEYVTQGGEGKIYVKGKTAYKIYLDPKKMIPESKMQELSLLTRPNIIRPDKVLLNTRQKPIGYTMRAVTNTYSLCELFPLAFRDREGLTIETVLDLIQIMQETIAEVHKAQCLIVDYNEVNFLAAKTLDDVYFIDVDAWGTPSFKPAAISPSVMDYSATKFSTDSDWFSFGIVSFQLFIGIHPFKGRHPTIKFPKDKARELKERQLARMPVFHKDVKFPSKCWDFNVIPQAYKDWYKALFFDGKRMPPPSGAVEVIVVPVVTKQVFSDKDFEILMEQEYEGNIVSYISLHNVRATNTTKSFYVNNRQVSTPCPPDAYIGVTPTNQVISAHIDNGDLVLFNHNTGSSPTHILKAEQLMSFDGRILFKHGTRLNELTFVEMGKTVHARPHLVANVMEQATKLYDGVVIQNVLGAFSASFFPSFGKHFRIQCPEFQGYQVIDAKYRNKVLIVIAHQQGEYTKFILKFDDKFTSYSVRKVEKITYSGINFIVLDNGIVVHINEEEELEIFSNKKDSADVRVIDSDTITGDMKLFQDGMKVMFAKGEKLYSLKMKTK